MDEALSNAGGMTEHDEYPQELVDSLLGALTCVTARLKSQRNSVWRIRSAGDDLVVRLSGVRPPRPIVDFEREVALQAAAAAQGLAPDVIAFDVDRELLISEYVDASSELPLADPLEFVVPTLQALHAVPVDGLPTGPTDLQLFEGYGVSSDALAPEIRPLGVSSDSARVICHHDVHLGNVRHGQRTLLIDWEYARCAEPLHELAVCAENFELSELEACALLERYFDSPIDALLHERFTVYRKRARLWFALWRERYQ
ncbi:MAG: phosphotransferase [Pseudomonadota bacterium]